MYSLESFDLRIGGSLVECLRMLDDRGIDVVLGIQQDSAYSWNFNVMAIESDLIEWFDGGDHLYGYWACTTVIEPINFPIVVTEYKHRQPAYDELINDYPDRELECEAEHLIDSVKELIDFLSENANCASESLSQNDHDINVYTSTAWYECDLQHDQQGYRDGSTVSSSYHLNAASDYVRRLAAYGFMDAQRIECDRRMARARLSVARYNNYQHSAG
jgi:hypothetical protein